MARTRRRAMTAQFWPLSGDVTQSILPWTFSWNLGADSQIGLINIDLGKAGDDETERRILEEAGSYGRQLGRVSEALAAVIDALRADEGGPLGRARLSDEQLAALFDFKKLLAEIEKAKKAPASSAAR